AKHASELTRQLLTFARKKESTAQVLDLNHSVQNTLKMLRPLFNKNIELSWVPGSNLWPVIIDHTQIDQILVNLVVNARDAISGANGEIKIIAENICINAPQSAYGNTISPGDYVKLSVSDTGCGMLIETQEKLFEPFFTTKEVDQGTGLGLSTVYGIVQENKGYIDVQSTPEHGTTFHVYLPRGNVAVPVSDPLEKCIATFQESETILLVEDDQSILRMCIRVLNDLGYTVLEAASSTAALQLAEEHANKIDLLITDIIMPGMNGYELANELKQRFPHLKLLFTSGYADNILNPSAGSLEQQAPLLPKPFTREQLASKIREVLDSDSIDQ
ncbi:MAG: ATP-binding protein, partial [Kiritimatiellaceae bacterium]|nr:ATP-binding protein [Kiritimatiellaceae bacterium]